MNLIVTINEMPRVYIKVTYVYLPIFFIKILHSERVFHQFLEKLAELGSIQQNRAN